MRRSDQTGPTLAIVRLDRRANELGAVLALGGGSVMSSFSWLPGVPGSSAAAERDQREDRWLGFLARGHRRSPLKPERRRVLLRVQGPARQARDAAGTADEECCSPRLA